MFTFNSSFIGYPPLLRVSDFHGKSDSQKKFMISLNTKGPEWEYAKLTFNYTRNSYGHRSKELTEINSDNYILFTGCSLTEGIGLPIENRYSNILSNLLQCDMYNLALGGTGNDIIFYNLVTWFSLIKTKPKLVVIQWTGDTRFMVSPSVNHIVANGPWDDECQTFITSGDIHGYFNSKTTILKKLIRNIIDVPIIEIPFMNGDNIQSKNTFNMTPNINVDLARDLMHPGIKSNQNLATALFYHIKKYYFSNT